MQTKVYSVIINFPLKPKLHDFKVRIEGLEPPRASSPGPKPGTSTNSAISARNFQYPIIGIPLKIFKV